MIHIVFQEADIAVLQKSMELDPALQGEIFQVGDDYAVGPLKDIFHQEGIEMRRNWWKEISKTGDYERLVEDGKVDDPQLLEQVKERLSQNEDEVLWIWAAQNKHDVSGYYWIISQLREFQGKVFILYLNNLPFISEKGHIFYPENLFQIPPKEFLKAKRLARPVTLSEFETDPDEWQRLINEDKGVRILEGGKKLVQYDYDFYDEDLKKYIGADWQKGSRIIYQFLSKNRQITGDAYLLWRLKLMLEQGLFDFQGELKNMKDFEVKTKSTVQSQGENE